ncbi:hypothetical protein AAE478_005028 [Parahypoxylon ruwenzoriense]
MATSTSPLSTSTPPTSVASHHDVAQFTGVKELYKLIKQIPGDMLSLTDVSPPDFTAIKREREARGRKIRFHYYADWKILIVTIPTSIHEHLHLELYDQYMEQLAQRGLRRSWTSIGATALGVGYPGGSEGEADSSGGPNPPRNGPEAWPTLVIEAGYSQSRNLLRAKMRWWFSTSNHDVKIVILATFDRNQREILLEKWHEEAASRPGATTTRSAGILQPGSQQIIAITQDPNTNPVSYNVARGALVLEFRLLFLRDPGPGEGDFVFNIPDLQFYAERVWSQVR